MSITSHAFGRVSLTEADAKKFKNQVTYGRPKAAAAASVAQGLNLSKTLNQSGEIKLRLNQHG